VYPALAVLEALNKSQHVKPDPDAALEVLWVGSRGGMEAELVERVGVPYKSIPAAGLHGVGLRALPNNLRALYHGCKAARQIINEYRPDALFFTGGYIAAPVAIAGRYMTRKADRPRIVTFVPDIEPGLALKALVRFSDQVAVSAADTQEYLPAAIQADVTGYPIREHLRSWTRQRGEQFFDLDPDMPTLLVFGGSRGARSINQALLAVLSELLSTVQVIHISGTHDWAAVAENSQALEGMIPASIFQRYHARAYLHEMGAALSAADLVLCRAGASSLGEFPAFAIPAILVPYPYAWRYQQVNAEYLAQRGAAEIIQDEDLSAKLLPTVMRLIEDRQTLTEMSANMSSLTRASAADDIARLICNLPASERGLQ
jgi:UDP-N-acetylglucosamine--N-acetylmuramyl-(pentapeptide) pyrophosphoryl-undecaprenol N-acetylglucosamine transferase